MLVIIIGLIGTSVFAAKLGPKEVCSAYQENFQDFSIRCSNQKDGKILRNRLISYAGKRNDLVVIKMMVNSGYDLKATRNDSSKQSYATTMIFVHPGKTIKK